MSDVAVTLALSASTIKDYMTCPQYYYLRHVRKFRPPQSQPAKVGTQWHCVLDKYFETRSFDAALEVLRFTWPGDLTEDKAQNLSRMEKVLKAYVDRYGSDGVEVLRPADVDFIDLQIPGSLFKIRVKMDKVIRWDRTIWVMEHKLTTRLNRHQYNPNYQVAFYVWASRQLGLDMRPVGCIVDIAHVTTRDINFIREDISRNEAQDAETLRLADEIGQRILRDAAAGFYPHNWSACSMYGECVYRSGCKSSPDIRERVFQLEYVINEGDSDGADVRGSDPA